MNEELLKKRISETTTEIFPLDRLLPLETIYSIFETEYKKIEDKNIFFKDRMFQRLREGYFAMFVAIYFQDISGQPHFIVFPSDPGNDLYIAYKIKDGEKGVPKFGAHEFDIKEYTNWSYDFRKFMEDSIVPKINIYEIIIPIYKKMNGSDLQFLIDYLKTKNLDRQIWVLGLPNEEDYSYNISNVTVINKEGISYEKTVDLDKWIDKSKIPIVFQDVLRFK